MMTEQDWRRVIVGIAEMAADRGAVTKTTIEALEAAVEGIADYRAMKALDVPTVDELDAAILLDLALSGGRTLDRIVQ